MFVNRALETGILLIALEPRKRRVQHASLPSEEITGASAAGD